MPSLADLKKKRGSEGLKQLQDKLKENENNAPKDDRIWKPKLDMAKGKGTAIVRLLPTKHDGSDDLQKVDRYNFKGAGGWFNGLALQQCGFEDPVQQAAINAFKKAKEFGENEHGKHKKIGMSLLPSSSFYANVYVIKDEYNPENEGKVMIWQFGRHFYKMISDALTPEFDDVVPLNAFDLWEGANLVIRMVKNTIPDRNTGKQIEVPDYKKSEFEKPSEFLDSDEEREQIIDLTYDVSAFLDKSKIKSFEETVKDFKKAYGKDYNWLSPDYDTEAYSTKNESAEDEYDKQDNSSTVDNAVDKESEPEKEKVETKVAESKVIPEATDTGGNDVLAKMRALANKSS